VIVDVSIDAGGVAETSRPTTHDAPTFVAEGVIHYCVANIPAADPVAAAAALAEAVLPFVRTLAGMGIEAALASDAALREGLLLWHGAVSHRGIAAEAGLAYTGPFAAATP
jgi:alanine dehydrogenase